MGKSAMILLDEYSRSVMKTNSSIFNSADYIIINNCSEITQSLVSLTNKLVILEGFTKTHACYSNITLFKELFCLEVFFIGGNGASFERMKAFANCSCHDLKTLHLEAINAALFNENNAETGVLSCLKDTLEEAKEISLDEMHTAKQLAVDYLNLHSLFFVKEEKLNTLELELTSLRCAYTSMASRNEKLLTGYKELLQKTSILNKNLEQFEIIFSKDVYSKLNIHNYRNRPQIVYFKEYQEVIGFNQYLETLFEVFRLQEHKSVKIIRLYDNSGSKSIAILPTYYHKLRNAYYSNEVAVNDYLCKSGDYLKVMDQLLTNKVGVDVLIILDCKDNRDIILSGNFMHISLCGELQFFETFGLNAENTITNSEGKLHWERYDTGELSSEEKMVYLSAKSAITQVLEYSKMFEQQI